MEADTKILCGPAPVTDKDIRDLKNICRWSVMFVPVAQGGEDHFDFDQVGKLAGGILERHGVNAMINHAHGNIDFG